MAVKSVDLHKHPTDTLVGMIRRDDILEGGQVFNARVLLMTPSQVNDPISVTNYDNDLMKQT
jgi:hypothetical protein